MRAWRVRRVICACPAMVDWPVGQRAVPVSAAAGRDAQHTLFRTWCFGRANRQPGMARGLREFTPGVAALRGSCLGVLCVALATWHRTQLGDDHEAAIIQIVPNRRAGDRQAPELMRSCLVTPQQPRHHHRVWSHTWSPPSAAKPPVLWRCLDAGRVLSTCPYAPHK